MSCKLAAVLNQVVRKGLAEKRAFEQRLEGCEGGNHTLSWIRFKKATANNAKAPWRGPLGVWRGWRLAALQENKQGGSCRGQFLMGGSARGRPCHIRVYRTVSSRERDTASFSLVSWHLAPGRHASLALEKCSWREESLLETCFSLSIFTAHLTFPFGIQDGRLGCLSVHCAETTPEAKN